LKNNDTRDLVSKEDLRKFSPTYWRAFRNYNKIAALLSKKIVHMFFDKVMDKLMDSDRVILPPSTIGDKLEHELYIGVTDKTSEKWLNLHTGGAAYSLIMTNLPLETRFKLSKKRKLELQKRILNGQPFY